MVEPTVLQTATINVLTCGYAAGCRTSPRIRQMIARPRVWQGHGQIAAAPMAARGQLIPRVRSRDGRHGQGGTAEAGGWGQGGFLMMPDPAVGAVSWPATR